MKYVVALVAVMSTLLAPLVYMLADNQPPYVYDAEQSYVVPSRTTTGRQITVHWKLKQINRVCPGSITRYIVDDETGLRLSYDPTAAAKTIEVGDDYLDRTFYLPHGISPGKKWYYSEGDYSCNPLQYFYPLRTRTPRISFEVTKE